MPRKRNAIESVFEAAADVIAETVVDESETPKKKPAHSKKKKKSAPVVTLQSVMGGDITLEEVLKRVEAVVDDEEVLDIYIKTEDNKAYYVTPERSGYILLWD